MNTKEEAVRARTPITSEIVGRWLAFEDEHSKENRGEVTHTSVPNGHSPDPTTLTEKKKTLNAHCWICGYPSVHKPQSVGPPTTGRRLIQMSTLAALPSPPLHGTALDSSAPSVAGPTTTTTPSTMTTIQQLPRFSSRRANSKRKSKHHSKRSAIDATFDIVESLNVAKTNGIDGHTSDSSFEEVGSNELDNKSQPLTSFDLLCSEDFVETNHANDQQNGLEPAGGGDTTVSAAVYVNTLELNRDYEHRWRYAAPFAAENLVLCSECCCMALRGLHQHHRRLRRGRLEQDVPPASQQDTTNAATSSKLQQHATSSRDDLVGGLFNHLRALCAAQPWGCALLAEMAPCGTAGDGGTSQESGGESEAAAGSPSSNPPSVMSGFDYASTEDDPMSTSPYHRSVRIRGTDVADNGRSTTWGIFRNTYGNFLRFDLKNPTTSVSPAGATGAANRDNLLSTKDTQAEKGSAEISSPDVVASSTRKRRDVVVQVCCGTHLPPSATAPGRGDAGEARSWSAAVSGSTSKPSSRRASPLAADVTTMEDDFHRPPPPSAAQVASVSYASVDCVFCGMTFVIRQPPMAERPKHFELSLCPSNPEVAKAIATFTFRPSSSVSAPSSAHSIVTASGRNYDTNNKTFQPTSPTDLSSRLSLQCMSFAPLHYTHCRWTCRTCTFQHTALTPACVICGTPRPSLLVDQAPSTTTTHDSLTNSSLAPSVSDATMPLNGIGGLLAKLPGAVKQNQIGDGNCLFRALSDQLFGTPRLHLLVRAITTDYIAEHRDYYSQVVADEVPRMSSTSDHHTITTPKAITQSHQPIPSSVAARPDGGLSFLTEAERALERYLMAMRLTGTWGDDMCLHAAAAAFSVNICVLTSDYPSDRWCFIYRGCSGGDTARENYSCTRFDVKRNVKSAHRKEEELSTPPPLPTLFLLYTRPVHFDALSLPPLFDGMDQSVAADRAVVATPTDAKELSAWVAQEISQAGAWDFV